MIKITKQIFISMQYLKNWFLWKIGVPIFQIKIFFQKPDEYISLRKFSFSQLFLTSSTKDLKLFKLLKKICFTLTLSIVYRLDNNWNIDFLNLSLLERMKLYRLYLSLSLKSSFYVLKALFQFLTDCFWLIFTERLNSLSFNLIKPKYGLALHW